MWAGLAMNAGWAIVVLAATSLLVHWGALGLATARLTAYIVHAAWTAAYAARIISTQKLSPAKSAISFVTSIPS
jgi:cytochrome b